MPSSRASRVPHAGQSALRRQVRALAAVCGLLVVGGHRSSSLDPAASSRGSVHTIFSTECSPYFDWQSIGVMHTHRLVGQPGPITRLSACADAKRNQSRDERIMPTHYHPSWAKHPTNNDSYSAYNMPASVIHWLEHATIGEEFVLYMDGDMTFRRPVDPAALGVRKGVAVGARYEYLYGLTNGVGDNFGVPNPGLAPHVGGIYILHVDDWRALAPRWLYWTERFRTETYRYWHDPEDPRSSKEDLATGDVYVARGNAPWISAMYGYAFAAAELGIAHLLPDDLMLYAGSHWLPTHTPLPPLPMIIHYGLPIVESLHLFDKQWFRSFDVLASPCPPRFFLTAGFSVAAVLGNSSRTLREKLGSLITIETLCSLNAALASYYARECGLPLSVPPPDCPLREAQLGLGALEVCSDARDDCAGQSRTSCAAQPELLRAVCRRSCRACSAHDQPDERVRAEGLRDQQRQDEQPPAAQAARARAADEAGAAECSLVAARGECGSLLDGRCALSCNGLQLDPSGPRRDRLAHCPEWARAGHCWHNEELMRRECPEACTIRPGPAEGAPSCEAQGDSPACVDENTECRQWATKGECADNAEYMGKACCKSCVEWAAFTGNPAQPAQLARGDAASS